MDFDDVRWRRLERGETPIEWVSVDSSYGAGTYSIPGPPREVGFEVVIADEVLADGTPRVGLRPTATLPPEFTARITLLTASGIWDPRRDDRKDSKSGSH